MGDSNIGMPRSPHRRPEEFDQIGHSRLACVQGDYSRVSLLYVPGNGLSLDVTLDCDVPREGNSDQTQFSELLPLTEEATEKLRDNLDAYLLWLRSDYSRRHRHCPIDGLSWKTVTPRELRSQPGRIVNRYECPKQHLWWDSPSGGLRPAEV